MRDNEAGHTTGEFAYSLAKSGKVIITRGGKQVAVLQARAALKFVNAIEALPAAEAQRYMASATGQYKFGNERRGKLAATRRSGDS